MSQEARLTTVLVLNIAMIAGLVIVGLSAHSLGVLAAGGDYFADAVAIGISMNAVRLSKHKHGHPKATSIAALINSILLIVVIAAVIISAIHRLVSSTPKIAGLPVLVVSVVAASVMILSTIILRGDNNQKDLNMRSIMLDTIADATSAVGVAVAGGIILFTHGLYWLDSAVALAVSIFIGYNAIKLLCDTIDALKALDQSS